tara:strand:+ start:375 stop:509 length:135 start_codon:yes stop_codon:yes gene_type:complete
MKEIKEKDTNKVSNKQLEKTKEIYFQEFDKWLADLKRKNGITLY